MLLEQVSDEYAKAKHRRENRDRHHRAPPRKIREFVDQFQIIHRREQETTIQTRDLRTNRISDIWVYPFPSHFLGFNKRFSIYFLGDFCGS